ncbi:hypothetical protein [Levilactobacillus yiduensis]|uniref:hypothetical protein n=1 Tax=Levilactobacillus yiduensis TaxID=2953880 RepID=UPI000EF32A2D|nr:hypothetical protein [Levilactobacillus yiduensis]AYM02597.1 hypothetical protein D8911_06135 [Levilactobacillus brevis]
MAIIQKRKLVGLTTVGLLSLTLGGTGLIAPSVLCPPAVAEAALRTQTVAEAKADLQKTVDSMKVIAEKNPANAELQTLYKNATKALKDSKVTVDDLQSYSLALSQYFEGYNLDGSKKNEDPSKDEEAIEAGDNHGGDGVEDTDNTGSSDPITDTQDAHEYEESTANVDNSGSDSNAISNATNNSSHSSNASSATENFSSTKPNSHSASAFSEQQVNALGNSGSSSSSTSSTAVSPTKTNSKKSNLPGTGEDSHNVVLISVIGILSILGLGGTALALWLRQRKHVNNE